MKQVEEEATKQSRPVRRRGRGREGGSNSQFSEETTTSKETEEEEEEDGQGTTIMATASVCWRKRVVACLHRRRIEGKVLGVSSFFSFPQVR